MTTFLLNVNPNGPDVLHRDPSHEECQMDDSKGRQHVDELTGIRLVANGQAITCRHCKPMEDPAS